MELHHQAKRRHQRNRKVIFRQCLNCQERKGQDFVLALRLCGEEKKLEMESLKLSSRLIDQMIAQARTEAPLETCGVLGGRDGQAMALYPIANALRSTVRYQAEPEGLLAAFLDIEAHGWDIIGIYHSHPAGPEEPSATDIAEAYYPDAVYIIISLAHAPPSIRGFRIVNKQVSPVALEVETPEKDSQPIFRTL